MIKVLIADGHAISRQGLYSILHTNANVIPVAQAENGVELMELCNIHKPDIVIMEISMSDVDGIEITRKIKSLHPSIYIIAFTIHASESKIVEMLEAGASGYLVKEAKQDEILGAIESVYKGTPYFCKATTTKLTRMLALTTIHSSIRNKNLLFTDREIEIIRLICNENTNSEIANKLFIGMRTVEGYRMKIMEKMKVKSTAGLVKYAINSALINI